MLKNIGIKPILACVLCVIVVLTAVFYIDKTKPADAQPHLYRKIIIDAGHGGEDGGSVGLYDIVEKNINLSIALKVRDLLTACGYEVLMTRTQDVDLSGSDANTVRKRKRQDLEKRLKLINGNMDALTVSIHQNKFEQNQSWGAQMFYSANNPLSEQLATCLQESFVTLQPENKREIKKATNDVYIIYHAKSPTVLAECGFLSNAEESKKLTEDAYQNQVAFTIVAGIMRFTDQNTI